MTNINVVDNLLHHHQWRIQGKSKQITTAHSMIYLHFKIPSKQLHWLDFILLKFLTYDIVIKLF